MTIKRLIEPYIEDALSRGKSVLLLGSRQTGKTTIIHENISVDLSYTFLESGVRLRFELDPDLLVKEIKAFIQLNGVELPTVFIDEVQRVPEVLDAVQLIIDQKLAKFVLTGSSARKLMKRKEGVNLLSGRLIELRLDALSLLETGSVENIESLLLNGSLPEIYLEPGVENKDQLLKSYVSIYLEQEVRAEALVRNLAAFSKFLSLAAIESGNTLNVSKVSQEIGVSRSTIDEYIQVLLDCLIIDRVEPLVDLTTRRRLTKSSKILFFDLGIRRIAANEGLKLPHKYYGALFEQFIGMEILKVIRSQGSLAQLNYWQDISGPEVDYIITVNKKYLPIEIKYTDKPSKHDARHLRKFINEYDCHLPALVVCQVERPIELTDNIIAMSFYEFIRYFKKFLKNN